MAAEAYLIVAEASIRAKQWCFYQETIDAMHEIRKRANAAESASYTLIDIRDEWSRELWFEGRRRIDLIRFWRFRRTHREL
ncbi:MAG: RagB/SusD family nutrient uptake outer membrane protein [Bacteroides cellulosilyticus]